MDLKQLAGCRNVTSLSSEDLPREQKRQREQEESLERERRVRIYAQRVEECGAIGPDFLAVLNGTAPPTKKVKVDAYPRAVPRTLQDLPLCECGSRIRAQGQAQCSNCRYRKRRCKLCKTVTRRVDAENVCLLCRESRNPARCG